MQGDVKPSDCRLRARGPRPDRKPKCNGSAILISPLISGAPRASDRIKLQKCLPLNIRGHGICDNLAAFVDDKLIAYVVNKVKILLDQNNCHLTALTKKADNVINLLDDVELNPFGGLVQ
jgi:hypothetical protein